MHDLTHPVRQAADHQALLRAALHDEVDELQPCDCLPAILHRARAAASQVWPWALLAGAIVGAALVLAGLLMLAHHGVQPAPVPSTRVLEA